MAGIGSMAGMLPYADSDSMTLEMVEEISNITETPLIAGACATHPFKKDHEKLIEEYLETGADGILNFPTVAMIDGNFREQIEAQGFSYDLELDMIETAREMEVLTAPYVFSVEEAEKMAKAGGDILIVHTGYTGLEFEDAVEMLEDVRDTVFETNEDIIILSHGGPIVSPKDFEHVFKNVDGVAGFMGFSGIERLPSEEAVKNRTEEFKSIRK